MSDFEKTRGIEIHGIGHQHKSKHWPKSKIWFPQTELTAFMSNHHSKEEYTRDEMAAQVFGVFKVSDEVIAIDEKFDEYRANTRDCNSVQCSVYYRRLMYWCDENGYTLKEISSAKQRSGGRR